MKPTLISLEAFKSKTALSGFRGRKKLLQIDFLLETWVTNPPPTADGRMQHLGTLLGACDEWMKIKEGKESKNSALRSVAVQDLRKQVLLLMNYEQFQRKKQLYGPRIGVPLQPGYSVERMLFIQARNQFRDAITYGLDVTISPVGGSFAHDVHTRQPSPLVQGRPFDQFRPEDFTAYEKLAPISSQSMYVHYMRKHERLGTMLTVSNGRLSRNGAWYSTPKGITIYAMDLYGNLFVQNSTENGRLVGNVSSQFNHSSLNAGNSVICAGEIVVKEGILREISNASGHYRPTRENLIECLRVLADDDLNMDEAKAIVHTATGDEHDSVAALCAPGQVTASTPPPGRPRANRHAPPPRFEPAAEPSRGWTRGTKPQTPPPQSEPVAEPSRGWNNGKPL